MKDFKWLTERAKELNELFDQLEKLLIKIISIAGWILILVQLFK